MKVLIISTSLHPHSRSRLLATRILSYFPEKVANVSFLDLAEYSLPLCDATTCVQNPQVQEIIKKVSQADALIFAVPIYNYNISSTAKNFIELVGDALQEKVVGFICASGTSKAYMSILSMMNSLLLDFRTLIVPHFVFADLDDLPENETKISDELEARLQKLGSMTLALAKTWRHLQN